MMMTLFTKVGSQFQQKTHYPVSVQQPDRASVISLSLVMKTENVKYYNINFLFATQIFIL